MRTALRLLSTRYGVALILVIVVLTVIGLGRIATTNHDDDLIGPPIASPPAPAVSTSDDDEAGDGSLVEPDNGDAHPSLSAGTADITAISRTFISAWLKHSNVSGADWRASLAPNATPDLMTKLKDTDPGSVPADTITGDIQTTDEGGAIWSTSIPVNGGTVTLRVIAFRGHWLVDGIDWEAS